MVKTNLWKRRTLVSVVLMVLSLAVAPVAGASPDTLDQPAPESPAVEEYPSTDLPPEMMQVPGAGQQCVNTALERNISNWVCNGAMLITPDGQEVLPVVPRPDLVEPVPPPNPQSRLNDDPDYDLWCEPDSSSPCIREIAQYQSEAKSNMIYGDEDGVVGTFDWIVHLNLNGRSTRITTTVIHDEGPSLNFIRHDAHCREVVPDRSWIRVAESTTWDHRSLSRRRAPDSTTDQLKGRTSSMPARTSSKGVCSFSHPATTMSGRSRQRLQYGVLGHRANDLSAPPKTESAISIADPKPPARQCLCLTTKQRTKV